MIRVALVVAPAVTRKGVWVVAFFAVVEAVAQ